MCGIAGLVTASSAERFVPAAELMASAMRHRGPDSQGVAALGECLLVNARLAIMDLSARGRMPMSNAEGTVWITYNGEVYNAAELRERLVTQGHEFRSTTDTEVILHLYLEHGENCVEKLRGMFAFAIWDARTRKLVLARDRLGIKPLYLARIDNGLLFGSELKTLLASGLVERRIDPAGLRVFLQLGHVPAPWTMVRGVTPLEPGHVGVWQDGAWESRAYWTLQPQTNGASSIDESSLDREIGDLLLDAMRAHLVSDVPVVLFLSGGTDSACLGALAKNAGAQNLSAMTVGFSERQYDETEFTKRTAKALDLPLDIVELAPDRFESEIDRAIWALDQPSVDGLNSYWISKLAAEAGYKVALSGQGGDELFGGYTSVAWFERFTSTARWTRHLPAAPFGSLLDQERLPFRHRKLSYLFGCDDPFVASQLAVKVLFPERDLTRLLAAPLGECDAHSEAQRHLSGWAKKVDRCDMRERLAFLDIHAHLEPRLLRDLDAMSMAHSIEVRPVLLDHPLVDFLHTVPASVRFCAKRLFLVATQRFLPPDLLADLQSREKRTFTFPFARWIGRDMQSLFEETFAPDRLAAHGVFRADAVHAFWRKYRKTPGAVGWSRIWSLFVLTRWCEVMDMRA